MEKKSSKSKMKNYMLPSVNILVNKKHDQNILNHEKNIGSMCLRHGCKINLNICVEYSE